MSVTTLEGIVKDGKIVIPKEFKLPESAQVYVVVPDGVRPKRIISPRLVNKADAKYFEKEVEDDFESEI
ncbi:MAG: hypothetical protein ACRD6X_11945 [Pyrinomonadaceae bacterium]